MDCRAFGQMLPRYLAGDLAEPDFTRMVAHEASCPACHQLACEQMTDPDVRSTTPAGATGLLEDIIQRTMGSDCQYIRMRLAERLDHDLADHTTRLVEEHLGRCAACRGLAETLNELPLYYAAMPRLLADASFAREVMEQTRRARPMITPAPSAEARPGFLEVLRALWRKPEFVWEGAVVCALLIAPLAGEAPSRWFRSIQTAEQARVQRFELAAGEVRGEVTTFFDARRQEVDDTVSGARGTVASWAYDALDRLTAGTSVAGFPSTLVRSWGQRALTRIGLEVDEEETNPKEGSSDMGIQPEGDHYELH